MKLPHLDGRSFTGMKTMNPDIGQPDNQLSPGPGYGLTSSSQTQLKCAFSYRYAHQLVYDEEKGDHYMFGGNPGGKEGKDGRLRLGDFWKLVLQRPQNSDLERFCRFIIRKAR